MKRMFFFLFVAILIASAHGTASAAPANVIVVNPPDNPVHVKGKVNISGTPSVNVTNTVPVSGSVTISGTPSVAVTSQTSPPTTIIDQGWTVVSWWNYESPTYDTSHCSSLRVDLYNTNAGADEYVHILNHSVTNSFNDHIRTASIYLGISESGSLFIPTPPPSISLLIVNSDNASAGVSLMFGIYCR